MSKYGFEAGEEDEAPIALPRARPAPRQKPRLEAVRASVEEGRALGFVARQGTGHGAGEGAGTGRAPAAIPAEAPAAGPAAAPRSGAERTDAGEGARAPRKPGRRKGEPKSQLLISGPVRVLDALRDHCDAEGVTYWEAIERWLAAGRER